MHRPGSRVAARAASLAEPASPSPVASVAKPSRRPGPTYGGCWPSRFRQRWCRGPAVSPLCARRGNPPRSTPHAAVFTALPGGRSTRRGCGPGFPGGSPSRIGAPPWSAEGYGGGPRLPGSCVGCSWRSAPAAWPAGRRGPEDRAPAARPRMTDAVRGHADRVNADSGIRVVILTGAGGKAFCAGSDISELDAYDTAWEFRGRPDYCDAIRSIRKPVIAAVNGYAYGGGLELAMSADIRLASQTATFAAPEIKLGWIGGGGVSAFLARSAGPSNAALMLYTGDPVDAATALSWGLVSRVLEPHELLPAVRELAGRIGQRPPIAAQTAKLNLRAAYSVPLENAIQYERDLQTICFATEDAAEGRRAFAQKRTPRFHGR